MRCFKLVFAKPSDGLEPSTPSLPWAFRGNWWQKVATVSACSSSFRGRRTGCHWLRPLGSISAPYMAGRVTRWALRRCARPVPWIRLGRGGSRGGQCGRQLPTGTDAGAGLAEHVAESHSTVRGLRNSRLPISALDSPSPASRAICPSCGSAHRVFRSPAGASSHRSPTAHLGRAPRKLPFRAWGAS